MSVEQKQKKTTLTCVNKKTNKKRIYFLKQFEKSENFIKHRKLTFGENCKYLRLWLFVFEL